MASLHEYVGDLSPWVVRWRDAEARQRSKRFRSKVQAERYLAERRAQQAMGAHAPIEVSRMRLEDWVTRWVTVHGVRWEVSTRTQRADLLDNWIEPFLGKTRLRDLGRARVNSWRAEAIVNGATPKTVNAALRVLSACLTDAVEEELIPANPCIGMRPLPAPPVDRRAIAVADVERIRLTVPSAVDRAVVSLLCYAGLRPQEVAALRWSDVRASTLLIARAQGRGGIKSTKTRQIRAVPILRPVRDDLDAMEPISEWLIATPRRAGRPMDAHNWSGRVWRPAVRELQLEHTPYEGRHTCASLLIADGRTVLEVAAWLGHSSPTTTLNHYGHLFDEAQFAPGESMETAVMRERAEAARRAAMH